jgi:hypothetical protein
MLSVIGIGAPEAKPDPSKPMCAVSNDDQRLGVIQGHAIRVKYVIPVSFQAKVAEKLLWMGLYKRGEGLAAAVVRPSALEGFASFESAGLEVGAWYVVSLKEGEVWPLITTHCTTSRFAVVEPVVHERPTPPRAAPQLLEPEADPFDTPPLVRRASSQPSIRRSATKRSATAHSPQRPLPESSSSRDAVPLSGSHGSLALGSPSEARGSRTTGTGSPPRPSKTPPLGRPAPVRRSGPSSGAESPPTPTSALRAPTRPAPTPAAPTSALPPMPRRGSAPPPVVRPAAPTLSPAPAPAAASTAARPKPGVAVGPVRPSLGSPAPARYSEGRVSPRTSAGTRSPTRPSAARPVARRRLVRCVEAHSPGDPTSEIGTSEGEILELLEDLGNGWLRVKRTQDETWGLIPGDNVEHL